jgi:hypothetical protein
MSGYKIPKRMENLLSVLFLEHMIDRIKTTFVHQTLLSLCSPVFHCVWSSLLSCLPSQAATEPGPGPSALPFPFPSPTPCQIPAPQTSPASSTSHYILAPHHEIQRPPMAPRRPQWQETSFLSRVVSVVNMCALEIEPTSVCVPG